MRKERPAITIANEVIKAGQTRCVKLSLAMLYTSTPIEIPVYVFHSKKEGPILFVTAAIHGDEISGVEIIRRLHHTPRIKRLRGTLITIPVVNIYGFFLHSRYLPDRRDLNRQFPGSEKGSMASKLANLIMTEVVAHSTHGIDLHTGAIHRSNYPQTRFSHQCPQSAKLAEVFDAPLRVAATMRDGSLREATDNLNIPMIVYEGGEALRFDEFAIQIGVRGILNVMNFLEMFSPSLRKIRKKKKFNSAIAESTFWIRAPESGVMIKNKLLGEKVEKGGVLCIIVDPLGNNESKIKSPCSGVIIGKTNIPLVNEGDAIFHIAIFENYESLLLPAQDAEEWD
jgi:predicted deacylase